MWDVRVCVACLATDVRMYSMSSYNLLQPYRLLTGVQLQSGDGMPRKLCWECAALVKKFKVFRRKCERAHLLLQDLYNQHDEISEEDVKKVDRNSHGLSSSFYKKILLDVTRLDEQLKSKRQKRELMETQKPDVVLSEVENVQFVKLITPEELKVEYDRPDTIEKKYDLEVLDNTLSFEVGNEGMNTEVVIEMHKEKEVPDRGFTVEDAFPNDAPRPPGNSTRNNLYRCKTCEHTTYNVNTALIHQRSSHKKQVEKNRYTCELCSTPLKNKRDKNRHYSTNHPKALVPVAKPFICESCGKAFKNVSVLRTHRLVHSALKPVKCAHCPMRFVSQYNLNNHLTTHTGVRAYVCDGCGRSFKTKGVLRAHMTLHSGRRDYKCKHCPKAYTNSKNLWSHSKSCHNVYKQYKCEHCCRAFTFRAEFKTHLERKYLHKVSADGTLSYWCKMCNKDFASHEETDAHRQSKHQYGFRMEPVPGSDMVHVYRYNLQYLVGPKSEQGSLRVYQCTTCMKRYTSYSGLYSHSRTHSDERPFVCNVCNKGFKAKAALKRHALVHTGEKLYKCDMCEKSFTCNAWKQHHIRTIHFHEHIPTKPRIRNKSKAHDKE